jgi:ubiquinone/menaquinone biosynthesis C-methylase UbiE
MDSNEYNLSSLETTALLLAAQETLRVSHSNPEPGESLSLQWYLGLEQIRHQRQGKWLPALLEFGKHHGDRLLGLGSGLGSDLVQYARGGAEVVTVCSSHDQLSLIRRNFELRGLKGTFLHASAHVLPLESASIDVVCLTGLLHETNEPTPIIDEMYRVLKPGGKVLAVVPAHYNIERWNQVLHLGNPRSSEELARHANAGLLAQTARRYKSRQLRHLFHRFHEFRICKRHLRRAEVPHLLRWLPLFVLERLAGRLLVFKAFKPVSAARVEKVAA